MSTTKTVNVTTGKVLHYTITKAGYKPVSGSKLITGSETINVTMVPESSSSGVYVFGDRIGGIASFFTYFDSVDPNTQVAQKYAVFVLDAAYRQANVGWSSSSGGTETVDTPLPNYGSGAAAIAAKESASYNTQLILDTYTTDAYTYPAFYYARNPGGQSLIVNVNGVNYTPQLPNAYEINAMYPLRSQLNAIDPTLIDGTGTIRLFGLVSGENYAWTSNESGAQYAFGSYTDSYDNFSINGQHKRSSSHFFVYPVFEIPVN